MFLTVLCVIPVSSNGTHITSTLFKDGIEIILVLDELYVLLERTADHSSTITCYYFTISNPIFSKESKSYNRKAVLQNRTLTLFQRLFLWRLRVKVTNHSVFTSSPPFSSSSPLNLLISISIILIVFLENDVHMYIHIISAFPSRVSATRRIRLSIISSPIAGIGNGIGNVLTRVRQ